MSGLCGAVSLDGRPLDEHVLDGALTRLHALGPDGEGRWAGPVGRLHVALGVARRHRVPEDRADRQPVVTAGGRVVVVADVVLDNRPELCRALGEPDAPGTTDAELVAAAYLRWGAAFASHLRGDLAVAVADDRHGAVLLARDHLGVRPLHVHNGADRVVFASTALAVTGFDGVPAEPDLDRAREFLGLVMGTTRSWVRDVRPVPPASTVWISPAGAATTRYWELPAVTDGAASFEDHVAALRAALDAAVADRARRGGHLGILLSGGLDSTAVAATAARLVMPAAVRTYTSVPPPGFTGEVGGRDPDESPLVRVLAEAHPNLRPTFIDSRGTTVFGDDAEIFGAGGTPVRNPTNATWVRILLRDAAADGVATLLTGAFGNFAFSADDAGWLGALVRAGRPAEAGRELRAWCAATATPWASAFKHLVLRELLPDGAQRWWAQRRQDGDGASRWLACTALRPALHPTIDLRHEPAVTAWGGRSRRADPAPALGSVAAHAEHHAAASALGRFRLTDPTADVRLLEVCARQPRTVRRRDGRDRAVAREAMAGLVPDEIRLRRRRGAQLPDWFERLTDARLELMTELAATRDHPPSRALVDMARLEATLAHWSPDDGPCHRDAMVDRRLALPRALAVGGYLRWFERHAAVMPVT
jgi:asparagine synthase (glutamine-hydrolysing)